MLGLGVAESGRRSWSKVAPKSAKFARIRQASSDVLRDFTIHNLLFRAPTVEAVLDVNAASRREHANPAVREFLPPPPRNSVLSRLTSIGAPTSTGWRALRGGRCRGGWWGRSIGCFASRCLTRICRTRTLCNAWRNESHRAGVHLVPLSGQAGLRSELPTGGCRFLAGQDSCLRDCANKFARRSQH